MFALGKLKVSDSGDWNIKSARDLLEEMRDKLYAECGDSDPSPQKVELCGSLNNLLLAMDTFQMRDCGGNAIGPAQYVNKSVVLNKVISKVCNVDELATAIATAIGSLQSTGSAILYNTPDCLVLQPGETATIAAGSVHSLSYKIFNGDGSLQIGTGVEFPIVSGESDGWEASTTLNNVFIFKALSGTIKIIITKQ